MDFLASPRVQAMNCPQQGAYIRLMIYAWDDPDCSLPNDLGMLTQMAKWEVQWGGLEPVLACFKKHPHKKGRLYNPRLYEEFLYCQERSLKAAQSGKLGGLAHRPPSEPTRLPPIKKDRSAAGFESVGQIADKHFKPTP